MDLFIFRGPITSDVLRVFIPPVKGKTDHDLAMIEFAEITLTNYVRPICLPMYVQYFST